MRRVLVLPLAVSLLACGGLVQLDQDLDEAFAEAERAVEGDAGLGAPEGPWLFAVATEGDSCVWQAHTPDAPPKELARHEAPCPSTWAMGMADDGIPGAGLTDELGLLVREDDVVTPMEAPPEGQPRRAGFLDGTLVVDTILNGFDGPPSFAGHTYSSPAPEGVPSLAIRWEHGDEGWKHTQIVDTDDGWDYARGVSVLEPELPGFPDLGSFDADELDNGEIDPGVPPGKQQEGWLVADTPHGKLATGFFYGEGIAITPPAALQIDGAWKPVSLDTDDEYAGLDATLVGDWAVLSIPGSGPAVVVSTKTGEELVRSKAPLFLMRAP